MMKYINLALISAFLLAVAGISVWSQTNPGQFSCAANTWINSIGFGSVPVCTQPTLANLSPVGANTVIGNPTGGSAAPIAETINGGASCTNALTYVNGTGFGCNAGAGTGTVTSIAPGTGIATSLTGGTTPITGAGTIYSAAATNQRAIGGLTLSNDGVTPNTVIDIAAGQATSDDATVIMPLASAYTKTTGAWTLGTGNGCLDTGSVPAANWLHLFLIERTDTGVTDILCSLSATAPTFPTSYTKKRRIGAIKTAASNIIPFQQIGQTFVWVTPVQDATPGCTTSSQTSTLASVPTGVVVNAYLNVQVSGAAQPTTIYVRPLFVTDQAPGFGSPGFTASDPTSTSSVGVSDVYIMTNATQQVASRSNRSSGTCNLVTRGWVDFL